MEPQTPAPPARTPWWLGPAPASQACTGLTSVQALQRLRQSGPNAWVRRTARPAWRELLRRLANPLVLVLLAASAVSAASGEFANFAIIAAIVAFSVLLDFTQANRAERAIERLRASQALHSTVLRDGRAQQVPVADLVPGDVVLLAAGERVPADGRIVSAHDFFVNQGLLTGEPYPVEKSPQQLPEGAVELQQAVNAVFAGSTVVSGGARLLVAATGGATALGGVAHAVAAEPPPTAFERTLNRFAWMLTRVTLAMVLFVMLVNLALQRPLLDAFLFAVALAVGLTPELLPMVVAVTLSRGAVRLADRHVVVKRLSAIQNLGAMDVLCTDKTGTLTEARIRLERCIDGNGQASERVRLLAQLNSAFESGLKSPLDDALLQPPPDLTGWTKIDEVPFDFERRRVSVLAGRGSDRWLVVKGAPDDVLALCSRWEAAPGTEGGAPLDAAARAALRARCASLEREGLRVLAVAWRPVASSRQHAALRDEADLLFAGFCAFIDPPKPGAATALRRLAASGVQVKIVSGDSELVALHLCGLLGLAVQGVLTGHEIEALDDAALAVRARRTTLFCRVNPAQKDRIVRALQARGHVVGYLGDGVNDAPALRTADVGLTVDSAVDVARDVADIVMLEHDLAVLHDGVLEGRRTHRNVLKYLMMGTSSNFGNMLSMAGAALLLPFLPMLPAQILLNNVLYDLSQAALPLDRVDAADLRRPRRLDMRFIRRTMLSFGLLSSLFDALTFWLLLHLAQAGASLFRTAWFVESLVSQVLVVFVIRTRGPAWRSRPSAALVGASVAVVALALALPWSPLAAWLGLQPPPAVYALWLVLLIAVYLAAAEGAKRWVYRRPAPRR